MDLLGYYYAQPVLWRFTRKRYYETMRTIDLIPTILHSGEIPALQKPLGFSKTIPHYGSLDNSNYDSIAITIGTPFSNVIENDDPLFYWNLQCQRTEPSDIINRDGENYALMSGHSSKIPAQHD
jgi:hypothetical protein